MRFRWTAFAVLPTIILASVLALVFALRSPRLESSLYDLVGSAADSVPAVLKDGSNGTVPVLVSSENSNSALEAAEYLASHLPVDRCIDVRFRIEDAEIGAMLDFCATNRSGLVSSPVAAGIADDASRAKFARKAIRAAYSPLSAPLYPVDLDPFGLTADFVKSLSRFETPFKPRNGFLSVERNGLTHILLVMELKKSVADDIDSVIRFRNDIETVLDKVRSSAVSVTACGVPMHSAVSAARCKTETTVLGIVSLLFVIVLSLFMFRSLKAIFLFFSLFSFSALAGAIALCVFFPSVHVVTLVFATSLLGLVVDYGYHWMLRSEGCKSSTVRNLLVSFTTTGITLLPLVFSSIPVLRQSAVFTGFGLAAALLAVLFFFPDVQTGSRPLERLSPPVKILRFAGVVAFLVSIAGLFSLEFKTSVVSLYSPPGALAEAERVLAEINASASEGRGFVVIDGSDDLESLLRKEESIQLDPEVPRLSAFMPSLGKRLANYEKTRLLYAGHGEKTKETLGVKSLQPLDPPKAWTWDDIPEALKRLFVRGHALVISSAPEPGGLPREGVVFCQPRSMIDGILSGWMSEIKCILLISFAVMLGCLAIVFRWKAFLTAFPSMAAAVTVLGLLSLSGAEVNLFHLLALFLLAGMGVDYAVFISSGDKNAVKSVTLAFLTSFVGFGALAFVSFPVVKAFGLSLGIGLPVAYATSLLFVPRTDTAEYASTPLGLAIIWGIYRAFGLRFFHFTASVTGLVMWIFSPGVRKNSPSLKKVIAFTRSLADKVVVMADGKKKPVVKLDGSDDAKEFLGNILAKRGVFVLSSHVGTIEVLSALGECNVTFHAWMEFSRTGVFNKFYLGHQRRNKVVIHPVSEFNPGTVFFAGDRLEEGDAILMAGDRSFGRKRTENVNGREVQLAEGVFRFAAALEHPVYMISCIAVRGIEYRAYVKRLPSDAKDMSRAYAEELLKLRDSWPDQNFTWEN